MAKLTIPDGKAKTRTKARTKGGTKASAKRRRRPIEDGVDTTDNRQAATPALNEVGGFQLREALSKLTMLGDDMFMRMQAFNLSITDPFMTELESDVLQRLINEERTPVPEASFLSALSQMWIFAAYELLRTWRQRASDIIKWAETGGLRMKLKALQENVGYPHPARAMRADQLEAVIADPSIVDRLKDDLRATHMLFGRIEALRVSMAKHEISGRPRSVALRPGYGRINQWTGSLDYELENGKYSIGYISRRAVADEIRALRSTRELPDDKTLEAFDKYMRGAEFEPPDFGDN